MKNMTELFFQLNLKFKHNILQCLSFFKK